MIRGTSGRLHGLVARNGSPLNNVWPHTVAINVERIRRALAAPRVDQAIVYGARANKSQAPIRAAIGLFRVIRTKPIGDGTAVVFVKGSSFSACQTGLASTFLVDPDLRHGPEVGRSARAPPAAGASILKPSPMWSVP